MQCIKGGVIITAVILSAGAAAQSEFDPPEELTGDGQSFTKLLYPSPVLFDVDGDGQRELVLGDLPGHLWVCEPGPEGDDTAWSSAQHLQLADGNPIRLHNW